MQVIWNCRTPVMLKLSNYLYAYETLNVNYVYLYYAKFVVMFLGVRPLTEDEHLYLRLCKLGKLLLLFKLSWVHA